VLIGGVGDKCGRCLTKLENFGNFSHKPGYVGVGMAQLWVSVLRCITWFKLQKGILVRKDRHCGNMFL
jgi:hypothetical protein